MTDTLIRILTTPSFLNPWFWILVAYSWSRATYFILDIPLHMVQEAERGDPQRREEFRELVRVKTGNYRRMMKIFAAPAAGVSFFGLTVMTTVGFGYDFRFAQAFALLLWPHLLGSVFTVWFGHRISEPLWETDRLIAGFFRHRRIKQIFGFFAILMMALIGVYLEIVVPYIL